MNHVTRVKFFNKILQFQTTEIGTKSGKFLEEGSLHFNGSIFKNLI